MSSPPEAERKRRLLYGRRKGPRLSAHQERLLETLLPQLRLKLELGADPLSYFSPPPWGVVETGYGFGVGELSTPRPPPGSPRTKTLGSSTSPQGGGEEHDKVINQVWLEVGFGAGEHLLWQAQHHPDVGLIGAEPYISGIAKLLSKIDSLTPHAAREHVSNIRIHDGDARDIVDALPDASLDRVFILFPDPWPKARHRKRRFVQTGMLDGLARVLKRHAELRFASDDADYAAWTLEHFLAHPAFEWTALRAEDWKERPEDWPQTRYEEKALHGAPVFFRFRRK